MTRAEDVQTAEREVNVIDAQLSHTSGGCAGTA